MPRNGPEPDGDTGNFLPDNDDLVRGLPRFNQVGPDRRHLGTYSTRFEGIDALETHFENQHHDLTFARQSRDRMLEILGFGDITFLAAQQGPDRAAPPHPRLPAGQRDRSQRPCPRPALYRDPDTADGEPVFVDETRLEASVNARLIRKGLAYAELYSTMPPPPQASRSRTWPTCRPRSCSPSSTAGW